jgi:hypothetical protein
MRRLSHAELERMIDAPVYPDGLVARAQLLRLSDLVSRAAPYLMGAPMAVVRELVTQALAHLDGTLLSRSGALGAVPDRARGLLRMRELLEQVHPHLDAAITPDELQDALAAEVREIAADRLARANAQRQWKP